jgi:GNAT superfamily N-acetyltransferase
LDVERWTAGWQRRLAAVGPRSAVLVCESDDRDVVAFADTVPTRDDDADPATTAEITTFYAHPRCWGRGFGRELMAAVGSS